MLQVIKYIKYSITCTHTPISHNIKTTNNIDHDTMCRETGCGWKAREARECLPPHHTTTALLREQPEEGDKKTQENHLASKCPRSKTWLSRSELSLEKKSILWSAAGRRRFTLSQAMFGCVLQVKEHPHERQDSWFLSKHCTVATISVSHYMI